MQTEPLSLRDVSDRTGLLENQINLLIAQGRFPRPTVVSGKLIWFADEIEAWREKC